jgi:hypothetical protein
MSCADPLETIRPLPLSCPTQMECRYVAPAGVLKIDLHQPPIVDHTAKMEEIHAQSERECTLHRCFLSAVAAEGFGIAETAVDFSVGIEGVCFCCWEGFSLVLLSMVVQCYLTML